MARPGTTPIRRIGPDHEHVHHEAHWPWWGVLLVLTALFTLFGISVTLGTIASELHRSADAQRVISVELRRANMLAESIAAAKPPICVK